MNTVNSTQDATEDILAEVREKLEDLKDESGNRIYTSEYIKAVVEKFRNMLTSGTLKLTKENI